MSMKMIQIETDIPYSFIHLYFCYLTKQLRKLISYRLTRILAFLSISCRLCFHRDSKDLFIAERKEQALITN